MRDIARPLLLLLLIMLAGTLGYQWIEGWDTLTALYQVIITLSTVGFGEIERLSDAGRGFTIVLIIFGITAVAFLVRRVVEFTVEGQLAGIRRKKKMEKALEKIQDHYIICGYGRVGRWVAHELATEDVPFVVIDDDPALEQEMNEAGLAYVVGNASSDEVLQTAGISRALGLVAVTDTDAENVFITMSARALNASIRVVSRANETASERKLLRAGAEGVIRPLEIAGTRIAHMLLHPATTGFLDVITRTGTDELRIQDLQIREQSPLAGQTLEGANIRARSGSMVLGIRRLSGEGELNPPSSTVINPGDRLIVLGTRSQLRKLEDMV